jgi:denticleless
MLTVNSRQRFEEGALLDSSFIRNFKCVHKDSIYINGQSTSAYVPPFACKFNQSALCGNLLGLVDEDGSVSLIDTRQPASDSLIKSWTAHKNAIFDIEWVGENQLVTASGDMHMILWDTSNQTPIEVFTGHTSSIKSINVHSSNQNLIVSGSRDGSIMMWDTRVNPRGGSQRPVNAVYGAHTKPSHSSTKHAKVNMGGVTSVLFHQDHFIASVGASDGFVKLWDTRSTYSHLKQTPPPCFHSFASPGCHGNGYCSAHQ